MHVMVYGFLDQVLEYRIFLNDLCVPVMYPEHTKISPSIKARNLRCKIIVGST